MQKYSLNRNTTKGFARLVRKNLDFIFAKRHQGEDVHVVTQLVVSLLGLIVFPWEDGESKQLEGLCLNKLEQVSWPHWNILLDDKADTKTLGKLNWHLRNALSHRRLKFSSDDQQMEKVEIEFEDCPQGSGVPNWRARINAKQLKKFCDCFTKELEESDRDKGPL